MKTQNENLMTQYLLGELSEDEKLSLEEQFFAHDDAFEQLLALEDELRYDYAQGGLTPQQRHQFEQRFLTLPGGTQTVAIAKAVLDKVAEAAPVKAPARAVITGEKPSFFQSLMALFGLQYLTMQFAMTAASLLLLFGGSWLLYQTVKLHSQVQQLEVARVEQEQQHVQQANEQQARGNLLNEQLENERRKRTELEQELAKQKAQAARTPDNQPALPTTLLSFLLTPGLSRDIDSTKRLTIPSGTTQLRLQLRLKRPGSYQSYQAVLQTLDGANLLTRTLPHSAGQMVTVMIPAKLMPSGDYVVVLKGKTADGQMEEIDEYHFSTTRQ